jgi:WhiB family redox-sensing transcriptional regulator
MTASVIEWSALAACKGPHRNVFFPPSALERKEDRLLREQQAKRICSGCCVQEACLDEALRNQESHGIWGGLNEVERRAKSTLVRTPPELSRSDARQYN